MQFSVAFQFPVAVIDPNSRMQWRMFEKFSKHSNYVWKKPLLQMDIFIPSLQSGNWGVQKN